MALVDSNANPICRRRRGVVEASDGTQRAGTVKAGSHEHLELAPEPSD
jgi:hypothetical protein